jgi:glycosyltransferase involved in cell wall biosynthesis
VGRSPVSFDRAVVVIPAHDEAESLPSCLKAVRIAAAAAPGPVLTIVVLDACTDESALLAGEFGGDVHFVEVDAKNVGATRAAGFTHARNALGIDESDESRVWYATTDADSRVDSDWLVVQMAADAEMVLGVVRVTNWRQLSASSIARYVSAYRAKSRRRGGGHDHVHGANMGFRADVYWKMGGFAALASGEDVDLVRRFEEEGHRIHRDAGLSVETSARREGRAPRGFAAYLRSVSSRGDAA